MKKRQQRPQALQLAGKNLTPEGDEEVLENRSLQPKGAHPHRKALLPLDCLPFPPVLCD